MMYPILTSPSLDSAIWSLKPRLNLTCLAVTWLGSYIQNECIFMVTNKLLTIAIAWCIGSTYHDCRLSWCSLKPQALPKKVAWLHENAQLRIQVSNAPWDITCTIIRCHLVSNYSKVTGITVFWTSNVAYCLFSEEQSWKLARVMAGVFTFGYFFHRQRMASTTHSTNEGQRMNNDLTTLTMITANNDHHHWRWRTT